VLGRRWESMHLHHDILRKIKMIKSGKEMNLRDINNVKFKYVA
jgi:hypothetical protein